MKHPEVLINHLTGIMNDLSAMIDEHAENIKNEINDIPNSLQELRLQVIILQLQDRLELAKKIMKDRINQG